MIHDSNFPIPCKTVENIAINPVRMRMPIFFIIIQTYVDGIIIGGTIIVSTERSMQISAYKMPRRSGKSEVKHI